MLQAISRCRTGKMNQVDQFCAAFLREAGTMLTFSLQHLDPASIPLL